MTDRKSRLSIRFVQQYDVTADKAVARFDAFVSPNDAAYYLAMKDSRDLPIDQKIADALEYLKSAPETPELP